MDDYERFVDQTNAINEPRRLARAIEDVEVNLKDRQLVVDARFESFAILSRAPKPDLIAKNKAARVREEVTREERAKALREKRRAEDRMDRKQMRVLRRGYLRRVVQMVERMKAENAIGFGLDTAVKLAVVAFDFETDVLEKIDMERATTEAARNTLRAILATDTALRAVLSPMWDHRYFADRGSVVNEYKVWLLMLSWFDRQGLETVGRFVMGKIRAAHLAVIARRFEHGCGEHGLPMDALTDKQMWAEANRREILVACENLWIEAAWAWEVDRTFRDPPTGGDLVWATDVSPRMEMEEMARQKEPVYLCECVFGRPRTAEGVHGRAYMAMDRPAGYWQTSREDIQRRSRLLGTRFCASESGAPRALEDDERSMQRTLQRRGAFYVHTMLRANEDFILCRADEAAFQEDALKLLHVCARQWKLALWGMVSKA